MTGKKPARPAGQRFLSESSTEVRILLGAMPPVYPLPSAGGTRSPQQAADNKCVGNPKAANALFREELVGNSPSGSRFTPFAVAAFSGASSMVGKVEEAYKRGAMVESLDGSDESEDLKKINNREVVEHVDAVFSMEQQDRAGTVTNGTDSAEGKDPKHGPEVTLLLRNCRGTGALRGLPEAVKDDKFCARIDKAELQHSASKAVLAASDGSFEGLRSETYSLSIRPVTLLQYATKTSCKVQKRISAPPARTRQHTFGGTGAPHQNVRERDDLSS